MVGVKPKNTTKLKIGRRKDLLLAPSKENTGDLSQSSVFQQQNLGNFKLRIHADSRRGLAGSTEAKL